MGKGVKFIFLLWLLLFGILVIYVLLPFKYPIVAHMDLSILYHINHYRIQQLDALFITITNSAFVISAGTVLCYLLFAVKTRSNIQLRRQGILLLVSLAGAELIATILKYALNRPRPFILHPEIEKLSGGGSPSFPSGHTTDAFAVATAVLLLFPQKIWGRLTMFWAFAVAYSRLVLGVHYPSDVFGGVLIGAGWSLFCNKIFQSKFNSLKQQQHA